MDMYIFSIRSISDILYLFSINKFVACQLVVKKAQIFIDSGLRWSIQDGIAHVHYSGVILFHIFL